MAWKFREGRRRRYVGRRVGGTAVVHFIKKNMWFLETAAALLHGDDVTPLEEALDRRPVDASGGGDEQGGSEGASGGEKGLPPLADGTDGGGDAVVAAAAAAADLDIDSDSTATARTMVRRARRDLGQ